MNQEGLRRILRAEKEKTGITWKQVSRISGVSYTALENFLIGCRNTSLDVAIKLVEAMGLELCVRRKKNETENLRPMQKNH